MLSPLAAENAPSLRSKYDAIRDTARKAERIVNEIVDDYAAQLDEFVLAAEKMLDDRGEISDKALQRMVLRLPILMYRLSSLLDRSAIESDIAKAATKNVYAQHYADADGTIPEREAQATLATAEETAIVDLAKHVYLKLKMKFETADKLFDAVRKVLTNRDTEKATFRKER
jgi:hypothetical protein